MGPRDSGDLAILWTSSYLCYYYLLCYFVISLGIERVKGAQISTGAGQHSNHGKVPRLELFWVAAGWNHGWRENSYEGYPMERTSRR